MIVCKAVFWIVAGTVLLAGICAAGVNPRIGYIRKDRISVTAPVVQGKRYRTTLPATLDLAERAALAVNAITECTDPAYDHEAYECCYLDRNPPILTHSFHDMNGAHPKLMEALPLLRNASGSTQNIDAEQTMLDAMLHMMGDDGLYYMPVKGRPWALFDSWNSFLTNANPPKNAAHIAALWPTGRAILALEAFSAADPTNPIYQAYIKRSVDGLSKLVNDRGKWAYFPGDIVYLDEDGKRILYSQSSYAGARTGSVDDSTPPTTGPNAINFCGPCAQAMAKCYKLTRYEPAGKLARKLCYWIKDHSGSFNPDGSFSGHFHLHTTGIIAMAETGLATGDPELVEFAVKSYEAAKTLGIPLVGYFPESLPITKVTTCEGCGIADMVVLATVLSRAGCRDYWEDVDRYVRNQFSEMQITDTSWIDRATKLPNSRGNTIGLLPVEEAAKIKDVFTDRNVKNRILGSFASWSTFNDWYIGGEHGVGNGFGWCACCLGNCCRALYYAWEGILEHKDNALRVNLLLNRASEWADIDSEIPYNGKVSIRMKQKNRLLVRIPEWVDRNGVKCAVNDKAREYRWATEPVLKQYIDLGEVASGRTVTVEFPMVTRTVEIDVPFPAGSARETVIIKGNDVVDLWPKGVNDPFYQRAQYRQDQTLWKNVERFSPKHAVDW